MRGTTLQTPRSVRKEGEEVLPQHRSRDSPAAHGEDHGEAAVPLQPMEVHGGADTHLQPWEDPMSEQVGAQGRL